MRSRPPLRWANLQPAIWIGRPSPTATRSGNAAASYAQPEHNFNRSVFGQGGLDRIVTLSPLALPSIAEYVLDHAENWWSKVCALRSAKTTGRPIEIMFWPVHEVVGESWGTGPRDPVLIGKAGAWQTAGFEGASRSQIQG